MKFFIKSINDKITNETIKKYINDYYNNKKINKTVNHYINKIDNFSITIFKDWFCTEELLQYDYFEINTSKIYNKIKNLNNSNYFIYIYVNYNYNNYFEIYNTNNKKSLFNIEQLLNLDENNIKIKNNFTEEINNYFSEVIVNKIIENNINIFNMDHFIFNDLCKNFTIQNIDIPIKERREILFLGNIAKEIICNDINCDIESVSINNLTGECNCKIYIFMNNLFLIRESTNNISNEDYIKYINSKSKINSFLNLKCAKESFNSTNLKNNSNFFFSIILISIYIILFCIYYIYSRKFKLEKNEEIKLNPPKIEKFNISDDLEEEEKEENNNNKDN